MALDHYQGIGFKLLSFCTYIITGIGQVNFLFFFEMVFLEKKKRIMWENYEFIQDGFLSGMVHALKEELLSLKWLSFSESY